MKKYLVIIMVLLLALNVTAQRKIATDKLQVKTLKNAEVLVTDAKGNVIKGNTDAITQELRTELLQKIYEVESTIATKLDKSEFVTLQQEFTALKQQVNNGDSTIQDIQNNINSITQKVNNLKISDIENLQSEINRLEGLIANAGKVKTVNGVTPDGNGNIVVPLPTKLSQFTNDTDFETKQGATNKVSQAKTEAILQAIARTENGVTVIDQVEGGSVKFEPYKQGIIKIKMPVSWSSTMLRIIMDVYYYDANSSFTIELSGYNYFGHTKWYNTSAKIIGSVNHTVRFGHDGEKCCIFIGDTDTHWHYTRIAIRHLLVSYSNYVTSKWKSGWNISIVDQLPDKIDATITNALIQKDAQDRADAAYNLAESAVNSIPNSKAKYKNIGKVSITEYRKNYFPVSEIELINNGTNKSKQVDLGSELLELLNPDTFKPNTVCRLSFEAKIEGDNANSQVKNLFINATSGDTYIYELFYSYNKLTKSYTKFKVIFNPFEYREKYGMNVDNFYFTIKSTDVNTSHDSQVPSEQNDTKVQIRNLYLEVLDGEEYKQIGTSSLTF